MDGMHSYASCKTLILEKTKFYGKQVMKCVTIRIAVLKLIYLRCIDCLWTKITFFSSADRLP